MTKVLNGKRFIRDLKLHSDYLKWKEEIQRYETYEEAIDDILNGHLIKYGDKVNALLEIIKPSLKNGDFLASQRNLQFRYDQIKKHNLKMYNCTTMYCYAPDCFSKGLYILLCGAGLGISLKRKYVSKLPEIGIRTNIPILYTIEDSIEGWAEALKVLISSFCDAPSLYDEYYKFRVVFDYSKIREKGSHIDGGFKAPGPDGLKKSLQKIEELLIKNPGEFKSILAYDIFMHAADTVLSGGVRRSATNIVFDADDEDMLLAKVGNWRVENPQRARSNNSTTLMRGKFTMDEFRDLVRINQNGGDVGFVFSSHEDDMYNPCYEIGFNFYDRIIDKRFTAIQCCNLNEINATKCIDSKGKFSKYMFYNLCRNASILGTLQAGYTDFPYLGDETEMIVRGEALLGVSITGWMARPELFDAEILRKGATIVKETNEFVADLIGIKPAARTTTVKPSGNSSVILECPSGIHAEHFVRYFRCMQINKEADTAKYLFENMPDMLEESHWSQNKTDYVAYIPCENIGDSIIYKNDIKGVAHLEKIKLVQENWVIPGTNVERCYVPTTRHNVSNTVTIDNIDNIVNYIYDNQDMFTAVSFLDDFGDRDYVQAPFTSVLNTDEIIAKYGSGAIFMSGLIVDGLHAFNDNLWTALDYVRNRDLIIEDDMGKAWIKRVKKFAKHYFKNNVDECILCMKDVHLCHKWHRISRVFKPVDFSEILKKPTYKNIDETGAIACSGGSCEI